MLSTHRYPLAFRLFNSPSASSNPTGLTTSSPIPALSPSQHATQPAFPNTSMDLDLPPMDSVLKVKVPTFQHVPKGARDAWADLLHAIFVSIIANLSDNKSWCKCWFQGASCSTLLREVVVPSMIPKMLSNLG